MVLMGAEGREYAQSTPLCWETLLWWDRTHGQLRWDTWTFLAGLSHPHLPCSALSPSGWWGTECPDCSFSSTIYTTWMKSPTQRVFPSTPANISPPLPVSDCILCSSKGSAPTHHSIISPRSRLPPVVWEEPRRALWGNTSAVFPLPVLQKHTLGASATWPALPTATTLFCVKELN